MSFYKTIIIAVDQSESSELVVARAHEIFHDGSVRVVLAHVLEPLSMAYGGDIPLDTIEIEANIAKQGDQHLKSLAMKYDIPDYECRILQGTTESAIRDLVEDINADLVLVGSHSRSGLSALLGTTASSMVHSIGCDVLAVKLDHK